MARVRVFMKKFNLTDRTNVLIFLVSFFIFCLLAYSISIPFVVYAALDSFLLKTIESVLAIIFLVINVSATPTSNSSSTTVDTSIPEVRKTTIQTSEGMSITNTPCLPSTPVVSDGRFNFNGVNEVK